MQDKYISITDSGDIICYFSDKQMKIIHRLDGPAYIDKSRDLETWWKDGKRHREDGPAVELIGWNGPPQWWLEGEEYTEEEFDAKMNPQTELTLNQIAEKFNIPLDQLRIKE